MTHHRLFTITCLITSLLLPHRIHSANPQQNVINMLQRQDNNHPALINPNSQKQSQGQGSSEGSSSSSLDSGESNEGSQKKQQNVPDMDRIRGSVKSSRDANILKWIKEHKAELAAYESWKADQSLGGGSSFWFSRDFQFHVRKTPTSLSICASPLKPPPFCVSNKHFQPGPPQNKNKQKSTPPDHAFSPNPRANDELIHHHHNNSTTQPQHMSMDGVGPSFFMIVVSELGDKTFFIAAILAMKHSRTMVLLGAAGALVIMTILGVVFGHLLTVIPQYVTHYGAGTLFFVFGLKLLFEAYSMKGGEAQEELREAEEEIMELEKKDRARRQPKPLGGDRGDVEQLLSPPLSLASSYNALCVCFIG